MRLRKSAAFFICLSFFSITLVYGQLPKLVLPIGHTKQVNFVQFSPDGKKLVTVSDDKTAKIWDVATGSIMADLKDHTDNIKSAQFSPDGKKVATPSNDGTAKIWDAATGNLLVDIRGHGGYVTSAQFSPPTADDPDGGKKIVTSCFDSIARVWDAASGKLLLVLKGHTGELLFAQFSADGKKILTASADFTAAIWDAETGKMLFRLKGHTDAVWDARFSGDGKKVVTASWDNSARVWDAATGKLITLIKGHKSAINHAQFSPACPDDPGGGKKIVTASDDMTAKVWDAENGRLLFDLKGHQGPVHKANFSPDGKLIVTASEDGTAGIWSAETGALVNGLASHGNAVNYAQFSPDGKKIATASADKSAIIWETETGRILTDMLGLSEYVSTVCFSPDGNTILTASYDFTIRAWDAVDGEMLGYLGQNNIVFSAEYSPATRSDPTGGKKIVTACADSSAGVWDNITGKQILTLRGHRGIVKYAQFSPDGKKIVTASWDKTAKVWDAVTGKLLLNNIRHSQGVESARFSPDGKKIVTSSQDKTAKVWDALTGKLLLTLSGGHTDILLSAEFSPACPDDPRGGKNIITSGADNISIIWNAVTGKRIRFLSGHKGMVLSARFSPDGKKIVTTSADNTAIIWDVVSGNKLVTLTGHDGDVTYSSFSPACPDDPGGGKKIVTSSGDNTCKVWNAETGELYYSFLSINKNDFLVVDKDNRYDGSQAARQLLYFICEGEVIELDQVKDQLWVPDLAERINKGETINSKKLTELNIFHLIPVVEDISIPGGPFRFKIRPQSGGLGETIVLVNGIEAGRYQPSQLKKTNNEYELVINKTDLKDFFIAGQENPVTVKTYTADNAMSSRGAGVQVSDTTRVTTPPNLYAMMVGVSDYKGTEMDLKYAAKDATDISVAISGTAKKLLNTDDKEHVFMYNLTTNKEHYQLPEKKAIQNVLTEIGKKATANDILLIFFAGHGVMKGEGDKKQFYFLTADASSLSTTDAVKDVGISMNELTEWMKPQNIKAQKRILIFDACNSGQAITDIAGENLGVRNDDKAQQIKAIDKLNEKSGLFILSASASNQSAYEMGRYSQGLLTYSLLKAIKEQPDILEDGKYLNISRWFNAAEKTVGELSKESGARQEPQVVTNTNFNIGLVDQEVMGNIILPQERPLFTSSNFQNADENISADDLGLNKMVNQQLNEIAQQGANATITYAGGSNSPDAFILSGRYTVTGNTISIKIFSGKGGGFKRILELTGTKDKLDELAGLIAAKAAEWAVNNK